MGRPSPDQQVGESYADYAKYLPDILRITNENMGGQAQANLAAAQQVAPGYNKLAAQQQASEAKSAADLLGGVGGKYLTALQETKNRLNPTYGALSAAGKSMQDLIGSYDLKGLSGGERAAAERGVNYSNVASGNLGIPSAINTVGNALQFTDRFNQKRQALGNLLGGASSLFGVGQANAVNPNDMFGKSSNAFGQYGGIGNNTQQTSTSVFGDILGSRTSAANTAMSQQPGWQRGWSTFNQTLGALRGGNS